MLTRLCAERARARRGYEYSRRRFKTLAPSSANFHHARDFTTKFTKAGDSGPEGGALDLTGDTPRRRRREEAELDDWWGKGKEW